MKFSLKGLIVLVVFIVYATVFSIWTNLRNNNEKGYDINSGASPAEIDCQDGGYKVEKRDGQESCVFTDGSYCELWEWYNGECEIGDKK